MTPPLWMAESEEELKSLLMKVKESEKVGLKLNISLWIINVCLYVCVLSHSAMSVSLQSHGLWPTRLFCKWNFLGKNIGVGCHSLLQGSDYKYSF